MKSSINVRYNVYAPKAERNRMTHLNRVTRTVYLLGSMVYNYSKYVWLTQLCAFILNVNFRLLFFIQIGYLKTI